MGVFSDRDKPGAVCLEEINEVRLKLTNSVASFPPSESVLNAEIQHHSRWLWVQLKVYFNDQYNLIMMEHFVFPWKEYMNICSLD